jgi:hypothetical protein
MKRVREDGGEVVSSLRPRARPGDAFAIGLAAEVEAFGRVMWVDRARGVLIEVFPTAPHRVEGGSLSWAEPRLFPPVLVTGLPFVHGHWPVIDSDPGYRLDLDRDPIEFVSPAPIGPGRCAVDLVGAIVRPIGEEESKTMERGWIWAPAELEARIRTALALVSDRSRDLDGRGYSA